MSNGFKKWLKMTAVLYGIFFVGGIFIGKQDVVIYMLFLLAGLGIFVFWQVFKTIVLGLRKVILTMKDLLRTKYMVVFKF